METVVIVGASGHAKVIADIVRSEGRFRLLGFVDDGVNPGEIVSGLPVLGTTGDLSSLAPDLVIIGIGDNAVREKVSEKLDWSRFATAVHPSAVVARCASIGPGTVIMPGAVVNAGSVIGRHCILNTRSSLDHDCYMDDFSSLAPGAVTGGNCAIGKSSVVSIGAIVRHGITVGKDTVIGAGAVVLANLPEHTVAYGSPAKVIRSRKHGDRYL